MVWQGLTIGYFWILWERGCWGAERGSFELGGFVWVWDGEGRGMVDRLVVFPARLAGFGLGCGR